MGVGAGAGLGGAVASTPAGRSRLAGIEGLRAIAALAVLTGHAWAFSDDRPGGLDLAGPLEKVMVAGRWGVILFFCLSGFLLYRPFAACLLRGEPLPRISAYFRNRALRILPAYWVALLLTALVLQTALTGSGTIGALTDPVKLLADLLLVHTYHPDLAPTGISPAWSLVTEVAFYALLPLIALAALRLGRGGSPRRRLAATLAGPAALLAIGVTSKLAMAAGDSQLGSWELVARLSFLANADLFAFGMAVAVVHALVRDGRIALPAWPRMPLAAGALGLLALLVAANEARGDHARPVETLVAFALAAALAAVALPWPQGGLGVALLESRPVVALGRWSYGIFLWHLPLLWLFMRWGLDARTPRELVVVFVVLVAATVAAGAASFRFIEAPALARKRPMTGAPVPAAPRTEPAPAVAPVA